MNQPPSLIQQPTPTQQPAQEQAPQDSQQHGSFSSSSSSSSLSLDILLRDLPLRPSTQTLLQEGGFTGTCRELIQSVTCGGISNLAAELGDVEPAVAARIHREVQQVLRRFSFSSSSSQAEDSITAAQLLRRRSSSTSSHSCGGGYIVTFSRQVDSLLGGGIRLGELTEIAGAPGSGKTQWAMQLAVNAKLPLEFGGVAGDTIYIDAEGSFAPTRCWDMAQALVQHVQQGQERRLRKKRQQQQHERQQSYAGVHNHELERMIPSWFTAQTILKNIHVHRVYDVAAQTAVLYNLEDRLEQQERQRQQQQQEQQQHEQYYKNNNAGSNDNQSLGKRIFPIRLVVVDSIAFHYRADAPGTADFLTRTRHLTNLANRLSQLAVKYNVAIVAINQMTTKRVSSNNAGNGDAENTTPMTMNSNYNNNNAVSTTNKQHQVLVPALGVAWAHAVTTRIVLQKNHENNHHTMGNSNSNQHYLNSNREAALAAQQRHQQEQPQRQYSCHLTKSTCQPSGSAMFQICQEGIRGHDFFVRSSNPLPQQQQQPAPATAPQHDYNNRRFAAASSSSVVSSKRTRTY